MNWIILLVLSVLSAICYRAGGQGKEPTAKPTWMPMWMRHSWVRDWICPLFVLALWFPGFNNNIWWWLGAYGATGGFLTTYWDWLFNDKDNFWVAGFFVGLGAMFLIGLGVAWWLLLIRAFVLAIFWGAWSALIGTDYIEEYGRGFFLSSSMFILLV